MIENSIFIIIGIINLIPIIVFSIFPFLRKDRFDNSIFSSNPLILFIEGLIFSILLFILYIYCIGPLYPDNGRELPLVMIVSEINQLPITAIVLFLVCLGCNITWTKHNWYWVIIILALMLYFTFYLFIDDLSEFYRIFFLS